MFFAPTTNMPAWFKTIVNLNPFTWVLNGARSILFGATDFGYLAVGIAAFTALGVITYTLAGRHYAGPVTLD